MLVLSRHTKQGFEITFGNHRVKMIFERMNKSNGKWHAVVKLSGDVKELDIGDHTMMNNWVFKELPLMDPITFTHGEEKLRLFVTKQRNQPCRFGFTGSHFIIKRLEIA